MGSRANIQVLYEDGTSVYFFTHWEGSTLPEVLKDALVRGQTRWDDETYLARIIFSEMVKDDIEGTMGFGISTYPADDAQFYILLVNMKEQTVSQNGQTWTFEDYCDLFPL
jgi:hypothetical protein